MKPQTKLIITTVTLVVALYSIVTTATATRLSINERFFDRIWRTISFSEESGAVTIRCPVTLLGSFHERTSSKTFLRLGGLVTHAQVGIGAQCTGGRATFLRETLPWHILYDSFRGTLPRINSIRQLLVGLSLRIEIMAVDCLLRTTLERPAKGDIILDAAGRVTEIVSDPNVLIPVRGDFLCPTNGKFEGRGLTGGLLFVRLI